MALGVALIAPAGPGWTLALSGYMSLLLTSERHYLLLLEYLDLATGPLEHDMSRSRKR